MRGYRDHGLRTLDEYVEKAGQEAWNRLCDVARRSSELFDEGIVAWMLANASQAPGSVVCALIQVARQDRGRREALSRAAKEVIAANKGDGLGAAGYHLHECNVVLDHEWLAVARAWYDADPEGAWGILESAAMYRPEFVLPVHLEWFEPRRAAGAVDWFTTLFSLARHDPSEAPRLVERALRQFGEHPAAAVEGAYRAASDVKELLSPALLDAVQHHLAANAEKGWDFFEAAVRKSPELFDDALLDRLNAAATTEPKSLFSVLRVLMSEDGDRRRGIMDRYVALIRRFPAEGIDASRYAFQRDDIRMVRPEFVKAVCEGFASNTSGAFEILSHCLHDRPELIGRPEVEAALANITHDTRADFWFFRELLKLRPEFTPEATLALFQVVAVTPTRHRHSREEEIAEITAISEAAHIKTGLEEALRQPLKAGSRRARALMAIMFRQKMRARRHVLLEALRNAAQATLDRTDVPPGDYKEDPHRFCPVWDFVMFIIDNSGDDVVSTAAAEKFLEGAFQLVYLCQTRNEYGNFLAGLDTMFPPAHPFPPRTEFLSADPELSTLYRLVIELARRFKVEPRLAPLDRFASRLQDAEIELRAISEELEKAEGPRKGKLLEREKTLNQHVAWWINPLYPKAFSDEAAEKRLPEAARAFLRREKKDLAKHLRDVLRAEAIRIAIAAVDTTRVDLYRNRLREVLGHDVDISKVEPKILPSFLWFQAIGHMANNTKYLKRLIEDRIAGRAHDWLRTEPAAADWAKRVEAGQPGVKLDRWRAAFEKAYQYRPKDALAEKRRRIKADLSQAKMLLEKAGAKGIGTETYEELATKLAELKMPPSAEEPKDGEKKPAATAPDPALLEEVSMNLERVRLAELTPDSDFEGRIVLAVETDPFEILFMGEYGFASCLSLRGSNAWSAVSNAVDVDKVIIWAKEPGGNVVGRRLLALTPDGVLTFRTYVNRHGLALDRIFEQFVEDYAAHCGTKVTHAGRSGPLLSDRWYDDGSI